MPIATAMTAAGVMLGMEVGRRMMVLGLQR
jgi:hypothetical protein